MLDLESYRKKFEDFLIHQFFNKNPQNLYDPINYILSKGGKRIRPILVMLAYELYKKKNQYVLPAAAAMEIFHNFTLVHDDIMDNADLRRGAQAVHTKFGVPSAILSGDVMMMISYRLLLSYGDPVIVKKIMSLFTEISIQLCEGQQMDMDFEDAVDVTIDQYVEMITKKTSILLGASLAIGGALGGANDADQNHLFEFGKNIGIAFQIQDDVLDVYGSQSKVGKVNAGDIINNKKTYLYLKAIELAGESDKLELKNLYTNKVSDPKEKIKRVKTIFNSCAVKAYADQVMEAYMILGVSHLDALNVGQDEILKLKTLANYLISRDS